RPDRPTTIKSKREPVMNSTAEFFSDIFSVPATAPKSRRLTVAVFPCGSEWTLERDANGQWDCPIFENGQQTGMDAVADTLSELKSDLATHGCTFRIRAA